MINDETPKHKKKKQSNTSKSNKKSKHKHKYKECLLVYDMSPHWAQVCEICGKIYNWHFSESKRTEYGYTIMTDDEVFEKYKDLDQYYTDDIWQEYVPIVVRE